MSNHRNELMDLHYASVVGSLLGARPHQGPAARDAEPETHVPREGAVRRAIAAVRRRRDHTVASPKRA
jgi:hypothetical protein